MKRRIGGFLLTAPAMLGAGMFFLLVAGWLRAQPTTRPRDASAQTQAGPAAHESAPATEPSQARMSPQTQAAPQTHPTTQTQPSQAAEPPPPTENPPGANEKQPTTVWELYLRGGYFMYPLTACSVLAIALILERLFSLRRGAVIPSGFLSGLREAAPDLMHGREAALRYCRQMDSPIARMLAAGIRKLPRGVAAAEKAIEDAGANEAIKLRRNMRFLYALGSVGTLLGLIGTISGMIKAFQIAAASGGGGANVTTLSTGIYEAMVNTFAGLAVAIVVTIFYYFFLGRVERLISEMNDTLARFAEEFGIE